MIKLAAVLVLTFIACGGGDTTEPPTVDSQPLNNQPGTCTNAAFDPCTSNDQCASNNCHLFSMSAFQVCTTACTPNDDSTCPLDDTGNHAHCNNMGICKPAVANSCTR